MRIIPAIDIIDGKCVRLSKGDYSTKIIYGDDPLEIAKRFEDSGIEYLHIVDLDGAKSKQIVNHKILESICKETRLNVDFGGGLKSQSDLKIAFESGASQVTIGSLAVSNPQLVRQWLADYSADKIMLGADCYNRKIATNGWTESSDLEVLSFIQEYNNDGIKYVVCTDISRDGMLTGPSLDLYKDILTQTSVKLIASGGVSKIEDLKRLKAIGCEGAIIGKAIYEGRITLKELRELC